MQPEYPNQSLSKGAWPSTTPRQTNTLTLTIDFDPYLNHIVLCCEGKVQNKTW